MLPRSFSPLLLAIGLPLLSVGVALGQLPATFQVTVDKGGGVFVELNLTKHSVRPSNFLVRSWDTTNGYVDEHTAAVPAYPARTYRGYVTQSPNELVLAVVHVDNTLQAETHDGSGRLWSVSGVDVSAALASPTGTTPPTAPLAAGSGTPGAAGTPGAYIPPVGLYLAHGVEDVPSRFYKGSVDATLAWLEYQWNVLDYFNARDAKLTIQLSEVIIRKEQFYFPTSGNAGQFNSMLRTEWVAQGTNPRGFIHSWFPDNFSYAGGYASGNSFYNAGGESVSVNALYHEVAHNWRAQHYLYGRETMSGSHPSHGEMNTQRVLYTRQLEIDQNDGILPATSYATNLHPRAYADLATTPLDTAVNISPLANDYDANGDAISIKTFAATTAMGGSVTESGGVLTYTPASGYLGKDVIVYEVQDTAGLYTKGLIHIEVINQGLAAQWSMEDSSGTNAADGSGNGHAGAVVGADFGSASVPGPIGNALSLGSGDYVIGDNSNLITGGDTTYPLDSVSSNFFDPMDQSYTAATWFRLETGTTSAVILSKRNQSALGFRIHADTSGGVTAQVKPWDGLQGAYTVSSGPIGADTWYHVAMVINRGTNILRLYLNGAEVGTAATLPANFFIFNGREDFKIGGAGALAVDETSIYTKALSLSEIQALHNAGSVPAGQPSPADNSPNQPASGTILSWLPGNTSYQHDVYFGTNAAAVAAASTASPEYIGRQTAASFNPGTLDHAKTYFWRIDEFDGSTIIPGSVWSFSTAATALTENLVLHLTMDNDDVQTADGVTHSYDDVASPQQDFMAIDATPGVAGIIGESVDLNAAADTLRSYAINPVVRPATGGVTISFWINTTSTQNGAEKVYDVGGAYFMLYYNGDLRPVYDGSSSGSTIFDTNINDGQWHHIVVHNNGAGLTRLFVDGSSAGTQSEGLHNVGTLNRTMALGSKYNSTGENLNASFDDFAVWQRALGGSEILAIRTAGLAGQTFNDELVVVNSSFEVAEGFSGFPAGNHSSLGTVVDNDGVTWTELNDARIWNRADIPPAGIQTLALGINASSSSCRVQVPGTTGGVGLVTFDYSSFSSSTNVDFSLQYNDNAGSGWVEAWSGEVIGVNPDWSDKPWGTVEVPVNVPGDVDLKFEVIGTNGVLIDNVRITGGPAGNTPPVWNIVPVNENPATEAAAYNSTLAGDASDPENDPLAYSKVSGPAWLSVGANGALSGTPAGGDVGSNSWTVDVSDGIAAAVQVTMNIVVEADNDGDGIPDSTDPDDDNDGMPDAWEIVHLLNPFVDDGSADPDGDRNDNWNEYVTDTDPQDGSSYQEFVVELGVGTDDPTARFSTSASRIYALEFRDALTTGNWADLEPPFPGTGSEMTVPDPTVLTRRYYRLRIELP